MGWLRDRRVLLPGVTVLARLVARVREEATQRLSETLYELLTPQQRFMLDMLLEFPEGARASEWDRLRKGLIRVSGPGMVKALDRVSQVAGLGLGSVDLAVVPPPAGGGACRSNYAGTRRGASWPPQLAGDRRNLFPEPPRSTELFSGNR